MYQKHRTFFEQNDWSQFNGNLKVGQLQTSKHSNSKQWQIILLRTWHSTALFIFDYLSVILRLSKHGALPTSRSAEMSLFFLQSLSWWMTSSNNQKSEFGFEFIVLYSWHNHCETSTVHLTNLEQQSSPLSSQLLTRVTSRLVWFKSTAVNPHFWGSGHRLKWWGLVLTVWGLEFVT